MHRLLQRQLRKFFRDHTPEEAQPFVAAVDASYAAFEGDLKNLHRALDLSSEELTRANAETRAVIEAMPDLILRLDARGGVIPLKAPVAAAGASHPAADPQAITHHLADLLRPEVHADLQRARAGLLADGQPRVFAFASLVQGAERQYEVRVVRLNDTDVLAIVQDITARREAEEEQERLNQELIKASRLAGRAEVATGVLHNVGNVLNSVNLGIGIVVGQLTKSRLASLGRAVDLLQEKESQLADFLTQDPTGRKLPEFLRAVTKQLEREQRLLMEEAKGLQRNIEHIKEIVSVQQSYGRVAGTRERLAMDEVIEDALRITGTSLVERGVELVREYAPALPVDGDRNLVLQILINLFTNARQALDGRATGRRVTIRVGPDGAGATRVDVIDNGTGIETENLTRIFGHGFTTKASGHGFGLHSSANAAREMGGRLSATSDGPGTGATFTLVLPASGIDLAARRPAGPEAPANPPGAVAGVTAAVP
jgi:signal transduction histidine kinase